MSARTRVKLRALDPTSTRDVTTVLSLNARDVAVLSPLDGDRLAALAEWAHRFDLVEVDHGNGTDDAGGADGVQVAGFVVTFGPGTGYDSVNYRWFADRYGESFYYLDRIVIDPQWRRTGVGSAVYDAVEDIALPYGRMVLEVSLDPPNPASTAFHERRGYRQVARLGDPGHVVALMSLESRPTPP
jgi:predicted GNAT superfamily acetyltransferase